MRPLADHIAIVTGAASGIGKAIAERLSGAGAAVLIADLHADRAEAVAATLRAAGGRAEAVGADVSDADVVERIFAAGRDAFGDCTLLVNNAGHVHQSPFEALAVADWDRMIAVHLRGTFLCCRAALPAMLAAGDGVIVNIASQLGQIGGVDLVHYSAAKAGIIGLTKALAREVSARGVRVNAVAPGPIETELVRALSEEWRASKKAQLPLGRFGAPEDVAETVAFLASPAAGIYVGQTLGPNSGDVML
ncbi:SDR family NAD(P)-dependent oxidoreductase [Inquilinus sp. NPDC058860]|uniref:SDR family NAD(P)-dependent oxidoreductase n=1 Tax=Inquilinus sp. NPDC058860 TaxID=3346652 RepID=UPI003673F535